MLQHSIFFNWIRILINLPLDYNIFVYIFFMFAKFQGDKRLIAMSSINCLNSSFYSLK